MNKKLNLRDLGGIKAAGGCAVKSGILLRSAKLDKINSRDLKELSENYRVRIVIDLRSELEKEGKEDKIPTGAEYIFSPVFSENTLAMTSGMGSDVMTALKKSKSMAELLNYVPDLIEVYPLAITDEYSVSKLSEIIKTIINNRDGAVLFHCTAGKDRTGIISAILLKMLGASYDDILTDYLKTNEVSGKNASKYSRLARIFLRNRELADKVYNVFMADKKYLDSAFAAIDEKFGSFDNFISEGLKLTPAETEDFRNYALE